jgi:gliding motility-associated-like protein
MAVGTTNLANHTYAWTPVLGLSSASVYNPTANPSATTTYTLTLTDTQNGCQATDEVIVTVDTEIPAANAGPNLLRSCTSNVSGAQIGMTPIAGVTYAWTPTTALSASNIANPTATPTVTTTYTLTATDQTSGCTATSSMVFSYNVAVPAVNAGADFTKTCASSQNPNGAVIGFSAVSGMTYAWTPTLGLTNPAAASTLANPNVSTTYTLTATNPNSGCTATDNVTVTVDIEVPTANAGSPFTKTCVQNTAGLQIGMTAIAGVSYAWTPTTGLSSATISNPTANPNSTTTYTLTATDNTSQCTASSTVTVTVQNTLPTVDAGSNATITCSNQNTALILGTAAISGLTYAWSPTTGLNDYTIAQPTATPTTSTNYTLTVTNPQTGCVATDNVLVNVNTTAPPINVGTPFTKTCVNFLNGTTIGSPGINGLTYLWSPATGLSSATIGQPNANPTATATYTLVVNNPTNGCSSTGQVTVTVNQVPPVANAGNDASITCTQISPIQLGTTAVSGYGYAWTPSTNLSANNIANPIANPTVTTTYTLTVTDINNGCTASDPVIVTVNNTTPVVTANVLGNQTTVCAGSSITLYGSGGANTYAWSNSVSNNQAFVPNSTATYTVTGTNTTNGCQATDVITITVNPVPSVNPIQSIVKCAGTPSGLIAFTGTVPGTIYDWTNSNTAINLVATGTGNIPSFTVTNNTANAIVSTITVTPKYTFNGELCTGTPQIFTITVNPIPTVNAVNSVPYCNGSTAAAINFSSTFGVPNTNYTWANSNTAIGLGAGATGNIPSFAVTNAGSSPIAGTITVTPSATNAGIACQGTAINFVITVNPIPDVNSVASQVVCNNTATTAIAFGGAVTGTSYAWTNSNTAINLGAAGTGSIAAFNASNTTNAPITGNFSVTPSYTNATGTCTGTPTTFTITVNPTPTVNSISNQTVCVNSSTSSVIFASTFNVSGTQYAWTNNNTAIGLGASNTGDIPAFTATNSTNAPITATITVTPQILLGGATCYGTAKTFTITVNPIPTVVAPTDLVLCHNENSGSITFTGAIANTTYTWNNNNTAINLGANGTGNIASFVASNTTNAPITALISITPTLGACTGTTDYLNITVNPIPTVNAIANQAICVGQLSTAVNFSSTPVIAGTQYNWTQTNTNLGLIAASGSGNIAGFNTTNTGNSVIASTFTVTPVYTNLSHSCSGIPKTFTMSVIPIPTVVDPANLVVCNNGAVPATNLTGNVTGTTYTWTNNLTSINLSGGGTGNISTFNGVNTTNAPVTAIVQVTPSFTLASTTCTGTSETFSITVNPTPTVNAISSVAYCVGSATTPIVFSSNFGVAGTTFAWANSATAIGITATGSGNISSFVTNNATNQPITGNIVVTPNANGCAGNPTNFNLTVNPIPTVSAVANQVRCNGALTNAINFTGSVPGTVFTWANNNPSINLVATGTGNIPAFTATNTSNAPITATLTVTPSFEYAGTTCTGTPVSFTITVNPTPTVDAIANQAICVGSSSSILSFSSTFGVSATTYAWTNSNTATGIAASGSGNFPAFNATNSTTGVLNSVITVTPSMTNNGQTCAGTPISFTYSVNPIPVMANPQDQILCHGNQTQVVTFTSNVTGTTYNWSASNTNIGVGATGTGSVGVFGAVNTTATVQTSTITITPIFTNGNVSCSGSPENMVFTVNPIPSVQDPVDQVICAGQNTTTVSFVGTGTQYAWTNSNTSIGLAASGTGNITTFVGQNTTSVPQTANIIVTPTYTFGGHTCTGGAQSFTISVNPSPVINYNQVSPQPVCSNSTTNSVTISSPTPNTTFSWSIPSIPAGISGLNVTSGNNSNTIPSYTLVNTTSVPITINFVVTAATTVGSCPGVSSTYTITVNPSPTVASTNPVVVCNGGQVSNLSLTGTGTSYAWANDLPSIGLAASGTNQITGFTAVNTTATVQTANIAVTPVYLGSGISCNGTVSNFTITVNPTPSVTPTNDFALCNTQVSTPLSFSGSATGYTWTNSNTGIGLLASGPSALPSFTATNAANTPITATIAVTPVFVNAGVTCTGSQDQFVITVNPTPSVTDPADQVKCNQTPTAAVSFTGTGTSYSWTNTAQSIGLATNGTGNILPFTAINNTNTPVVATVEVTPIFVGSGASCPGSPQNFTFTVNPTPVLVDPANQTVCNGGSTGLVNLVGTATSYTWTNNTTAIGLNASGQGNIPVFTASNNTNTPVVAQVVFTPIYTGGGVSCPGTTQNMTFTVNPTPSVTAPSTQVVCDNSLTSAVNFSGTATSYTWTNSLPSIGLLGNGTGNIASFTALNASSVPVSSTVSITPIFTGGQVSCPGPVQTFTITVNPTPIVNDLPDQTICNNTSTSVLNFSGTGTSYTWTNSVPSIGLVAAGTGNIASFTAANSSSNPLVSTITVTPQYLNSGVTCTGTQQTIVLTVNPTPIANVPANQVHCNNQIVSITNLTGTGTSYTWTNSNPSIGLAANGTGNIPSFTATNTGFAPISATISITPHFLNNGVACYGTPISYTITVNPTPIVNDPADQVICSGSLTTAIAFQGYAGTTYNWTNTMSSIGLAASGTGDIAAFTGQNTGTSPLTGTISVTPAFQNGGLTCYGTAQVFTITVNPSPVVGFSAQNQVLCSGGISNSVTVSSTTPNANITWNVSNAPSGISGLTTTSGTNTIPSYTLVNSTNIAQTIHFVVSAATSVGGCPGASSTYSITVNPSPVVNAVTPIVVCNGGQVNGINFSGTGTSYNWTNSLPSIGIAVNGTNTIAAFNAVNGTATVQTATISVTPVFLGNGTSCNGSVSNFTITVNPTPVVTPIPDFALCNNAVSSPVSFAGSATSYSWTNSNTAMGLVANGVNTLPSFTALNGTGTPVTSTINVTPIFVNAGVTCTGTQDQITITVNPTPIVNDPADQVLCNQSQTAAVNFSGTATQYVWTNSSPSIGLAASGSGNILAFTALNSGSSPVTATIEVTPQYVGSGASCPGSPQSFSFTVNPTPSVVDPANQTICNGASTTQVSLVGTATNYSWTNNNPSVGLAATGNGNILSFTATNSSTTPVIAQVTITPQFLGSAISCPGTAQTMTFTVNPTPSLTAPAAQVVCNNSQTPAVNFSGSGTSYNWINSLPSVGLAASGSGNISSFLAVNNSSVPVNANVTITPVYTGGQVSCTGPTQTYTITVNPTPMVNDLPNQTICNGSSTIPLNFTGNGTSYSWTNTLTSIGLGASGTGNISSFTALNATNAALSSTVTVTPQFLNNGLSCSGTQETIILTINPTPTASAPSTQIYCNNQVTPSTSIVGTGTNYTWTNSNPAIGLAASGTGNIPSFTATNASSAPITSTISITPRFLNNGVECLGTPVSYTVTVNPTPVVTDPGDLSICNGALTPAINFTGTATQYNWTNTAASIGLASAGINNIAAFNANNTGSTPLVATVNITPIYINGGVSCPGVQESFTITVNPTPVANDPADVTYCHNQNTVPINLTGTGTNYTWSNNNPSIGLGSNGQGLIPSFQTINNGNGPVVSTITVTPFYTFGSNVCAGPTQNFTITVNHVPTVTNLNNVSVCGGSLTNAISFAGTANSFVWANSNPAIGLPATGNGIIPVFAAINNTAQDATATISVTPQYVSGGVTCPGVAQPFNILVRPTPLVGAIFDQTICNQMSFSQGLTSSVPSTFEWSAISNPNVTGEVFLTQTSSTISNTLTNTTTSLQQVQYTVNAISVPYGCVGPDSLFTVTVVPDVLLNIPSTVEICSGATVSAFLAANVPSNFTWYTTFDNPNITGESLTQNTGSVINDVLINNSSTNQLVIYAVTPISQNGTCYGATQTIAVTVKPLLELLNTDTVVICSGSAVNLTLNANTNVNFNWYANQSVNVSGESLSAVSSSIITDILVNTTNAPQTVLYNVVGTSGATGCSSPILPVWVIVNPIPIMNPISNLVRCNASQANIPNFSSSVLNATYQWTNSNPNVGLALNGTGNIPAFVATNINYAPINSSIQASATYTNLGQTCTGTAIAFTLTVNPSPTAYPINSQVYCNGANTSPVGISGPVNNTVYNWSSSTPSIGAPVSGTGNIPSFAVSNIGAVPVQSSIQIQPAYTFGGQTCYGPTSGYTITVQPTPTVNPIASQTICDGTNTQAVQFTGNSNAVSYNWTSSLPNIGMSATGSGNITAFQANNNTNSPVTAIIAVTPQIVIGNLTCQGTPTTFGITVNPIPAVDPILPLTFCNNTVSQVNFTSSFMNNSPNVFYNWTNSNLAIGIPATGNDDISFLATNTSNGLIQGVVQVTPVYINNAVACNGLPQNVSITINPTPTVDTISNVLVCSGQNVLVNFNTTFNVAQTNYSWTSSNPSVGTGALGNGAALSFTSVNNTAASQHSTVTVTPSFTNSGVTCQGVAETFDITVNPIPVVNAVNDQVLCSNSNTTPITFSSNLLNAQFNWTNNNALIGLPTSGVGAIPSFVATNNDTIQQNATINVSVLHTSNGLTCQGLNQLFDIIVNPLPVAFAVNDQTLCANTPTTAVIFDGNMVNNTYSWANSNPLIGLSTTGNGNIVAFTALNPTSVAQAATVTVTPQILLNGVQCIGQPIDFEFLVHPAPTVNAVQDITVCEDFYTPQLTFGGQFSGTQFAWYNDNTAIGLGATGQNTISPFLATNATNVPLVGNINVVPSIQYGNLSCYGSPTEFSITVNPDPQVYVPQNQVVCNGAQVGTINFSGPTTGATYVWTNNNPSIGLAASGTGNIAAFTAINTGNTPIVATVTVTAQQLNGTQVCAGNSVTFTITVNPLVSMQPVASTVVCAGTQVASIPFVGNAQPSVFHWTNSNPTIGIPANGTGPIPAFTAINAGAATQVATITVTPSFVNGVNVCAITSQSFTISVNPQPQIVPIAAQTVCAGSSVSALNFNSNTVNTTFNWINSNTATGLAASGTGNIAPYIAQNATNTEQVSNIVISATYTAGGQSCTSTTSTSITVNPIPNVVDPANQTLCVGNQSLPVSFTGNVVGTNFVWTNSNPAIGLPSSGTGNIPSITGLNPGQTPLVSTIAVQAQYSNGGQLCYGNTETFTITVNPQPQVLAPNNQVVCNGAQIAAVNFTGPATGTTYIWSNNNPSIGIPANGTGNIAATVATNTGNTPLIATITVTAQYVNGTQICIGNSETFTITVNPTPNVVDPANQNLCVGNQSIPVAFTGNVTGAIYSWTNNNAAIGLPTFGTGNIASITAQNPGQIPIVATFAVQAQYANAGLVCLGNTETFTLTVNPQPQVLAPNNQVVCNGAQFAAVNFTGPATGTTYIWSNNNPSIGIPANGTGNIAATVATNTGNTPLIATITVTAQYVNGTQICTGNSETFTITVNPSPNVVDPANQNLCVGNQSLPVIFTGNVTGTTYAWTNNNPSIGIPSSGTGNIASIMGQNPGQTPLVATIAVQAQYNYGGLLCLGNTETFTITVNPQPQVVAPLNQVVCNGAQTASVNFTGSSNGNTYFWTNNTPSIGLLASGSGNIASFTATNNGNTPLTATITVTAQYLNGTQVCTGNAETFTITVNPSPIMVPTPNVTVCSGTAFNGVSFASNVPNATFNWVNNQTLIGLGASGSGSILPFVPSVSTTVPVTAMIQVQAVDTYGVYSCSSPIDTFLITVNPIPSFNNLPNQTVCAGQQVPLTFITGSVINTTYNWTNNNNTIGLPSTGQGNIPSFTAINNGANPVVANIEVASSLTNNQVACYGNIQTFTFTVNPTPQVADAPDQVICSGATINGVQMQGTLPNAYYTWTNSIPSIGLAANGIGNIPSFTGWNQGTTPAVAQITYTPNYSNNAITCQGTPQSYTVTINPIPAVVAHNDVVVCDNEAIPSVVLSGPVPSTNYAWTNSNLTIGLNQSNGTNVIPTFVGNTNNNVPNIAQMIVNATYTNAGVTCQGNIDTFLYVVNPIPNVLDPLDEVFCAGEVTQLIDFTGSVPGTAFNWTNNTAAIGLASAGSGDIAPFMAVNNTNAPLVATLVVQAAYTNMNTTCLGNTEQMTITVNPRPNVEPVSDQVLCHNDNVNPVQFSGSVPGTVYNWFNNETSIGLAANGTGNIAGFVGLNPGASPVVSTVDVTPSYTNAGVTCNGSVETFTITVNPWAYLQNLPVTICSGQNTNIDLETTIAAATSWSAQSNPNVNGETQTTQYSAQIQDVLVNFSNVQQVVNYQVELVSQPYGCASGPYPILVSVQPPVNVDFAVVTQLKCSDLPVLFDNNSVGNSSYTWSYGDGDTAYTYDGYNVYADYGVYDVTLIATDNQTLCQDSMSVIIDILASPEVGFTSSITDACAYVNVIFTDTIQDPTTNVYWTFGDGENSYQFGQVDHQFAQPGCYDITLYVTGTNGCTVADTVEDMVCVVPAPIADFYVDNTVHLIDDATFYFDNQSQYALYYDWTFGDGDTSVATNPIHEYNGVGEYLVTLTASNALGCADTANLTVIVKEEFLLYVPNTFTPNDDDTNDDFKPIINNRYVESSYHFMIFNRWGEMVFESYDANYGWDGTYGADMNLPVQDGVYSWVLSLKMRANEDAIRFTGHVSLLK